MEERTSCGVQWNILVVCCWRCSCVCDQYMVESVRVIVHDAPKLAQHPPRWHYHHRIKLHPQDKASLVDWGTLSSRIFLDPWLCDRKRQHGVVVYKFRLCQALHLTYVCLDRNAMWPLTSIKGIPEEEKSLQSRILEQTTSSGLRWNWLYLNHTSYIFSFGPTFAELSVLFLLLILSFNLSICNSLARAARSPGWMEGFKDRPPSRKSQDQGSWAKMRAWFKGCISLLTEKKCETDNHKLVLFPFSFFK